MSIKVSGGYRQRHASLLFNTSKRVNGDVPDRMRHGYSARISTLEFGCDRLRPRAISPCNVPSQTELLDTLQA